MYTARSVVGDAENGYTLERAWHSCTPPCDTALFRSLLDLSGDKRNEEHAQDYLQSNIPETVGVRGQADLVDLQLFEDNGYKFILD